MANMTAIEIKAFLPAKDFDVLVLADHNASGTNVMEGRSPELDAYTSRAHPLR